MIKEIGSEFWIENSVDIASLTIPSCIFKSKNTKLTSSGRGAISLILEQVDNEVISKTVLLPSYLCESMIIPFINKGYECYFYNINSDLRPDIKSIHRYDKKDIGVFLHMGYFGFHTNDNLIETINFFKNKKTIVVEDITHSLFSESKDYNCNDFLLASLRKWLGIASGGLVSTCHDICMIPKYPQYEFYGLREKALKLKADYMETKDRKLKAQFLELLNSAEEVLNIDPNCYSIDQDSVNILNELNVEMLVHKRRENFMYLLNNIQNRENIEPIFIELPNNICPLFFPICVKKDREKLRESLTKKEIYCPIHWPKPERINCEHISKNEDIYDKILSIPWWL